ncbi:MAG: PTS sugar transporter subunit IIB [Lacticaseibacillus paracasei]
MGKIIFSRIDFRLIHGQVVTKWIKQYPATNIVIINDPQFTIQVQHPDD